MDKKQILALDSKKHVKIWLLHKLGMSRREIAEALGTNPGHVGNEIKAYEKNEDKRKAAEAMGGPTINEEYERQRLINAGMPDVADQRYPIKKIDTVEEEVKKEEPKKEAQSFGERMKEARAKKAAENASKSPEDLEYEKLMRILKQTNSLTAKELFAEFGIRDEQEMYGTAKRSHIFDKQYSYFSERKNIIIALKTLHVLAKLMPIKTTVTQKLVSHEDQHRYENGEDTESEYGVSRRVELDLQIFDKKSGEKIGTLGHDSVSLSINNKDFKEAINNVKVYFKDGSTPLKPTVNFSKILSEVNKKAEEKKEADKWKTAKVPVGQKTQAKQDFEIWRQKTLKDVFEWLKARGFKRSDSYFDEAKEESLILKEYVNKLINYPVFYGMEMGYDVDKSYYKGSASITWQITANKYATKNKFDKEWPQYYEENRGYSPDVNGFVAKTFAKEINPILGTNYSSSGYAYDSSKIGFSVWNQKSSNGSRLGKGGILEGPKHGDGGIKAKSPNGPLEVEGGEIIINAKAAKEHCQELSEINQSAGGGVAFPCDHPAIDGIQGPMNGKGAEIQKDWNVVYFMVDSDGADQLLHENFKSHVDYHELPNGDVLYVMPRQQYDRFFDLADSTSQEFGASIEEVNENGEPLNDKYSDNYLDEAEIEDKEERIEEGVEVEKEHTDLYNEISQRLEADGHKMPMSKDEFFRMIAAAHIKERGDYYPLLKKYVEHAPSLMDKPYYLLTKEEVIACRDFIEMREAAGIELTAKCQQRLKDLARYSMVKFNTLLKNLK